jgi:hypothetical protein
MRTREAPMSKLSLAARRQELIERCAEQRTGLAYELRALRPSVALAEHPVVAYLAANRKWVAGALGAGLSLALLGRKRLPGLAGSVQSIWRTARGALALLARLRG